MIKETGIFRDGKMVVCGKEDERRKLAAKRKTIEVTKRRGKDKRRNEGTKEGREGGRERRKKRRKEGRNRGKKQATK